MIRHVKVVMLAALLACMAATALLNEFSIDWYPPAAQQADGQWVHYRASDVRVCMGARLLASVGDPSSQRHWFGCANALWKANALDAFGWRYWALISTSGLTLLAAFGFALAVRFGRMPFRVVRGRRLLTGKEAERSFKLAARREASHSGIGLDLIPEPAVSFERETRHWLIWGSVGAGKTQTMTHLVLCRTKQDARELANRLIPDSQDPMWSESAREILVVCLATLMATKGVDWTWSDLHKIGTSSAGTLAAMARDHHIDAIRLLENQDSRTTQSALSTFQTHMNVVATLAEAWTGDTAGRFSVSHWLHNPKPGCPVILQHDLRYPGLSNMWIGGMLTLLASAVGSPSLTESRHRRIWIFTDEFPQLPRIANFSTFLDLGRSKGVVAVLCAQDLAQLRATYGHERAEAWVGMIGTKSIAVGTVIADRPPHRSTQAAYPHAAPTSGV